MIGLSWWKRGGLAAAGGLAVTFVVTLNLRSGHSAEPQAPVARNLYTGSQSCVSCHNVTAQTPQNPYKNSLDFVKLNEFDTWRNQDKHSLAYDNLTGDRGTRIGQKLQKDVTKPEAGCLGCHSAGAAELENRVLGNLFNRNEGVSCENCHGPSSNWGGNSHALGTLRMKSESERSALGLVDLRTAEHQAQQCLSCHVGSVSEQKVITHAMYAAGHPPLPSVEVAFFSDVIPRHWYLPTERSSDAVRKALGTKTGQADRTKLAIVGAAVALRTTMNLIAEETLKGDGPRPPGQGWPDYARFDCYACHHALKRESWRQERGYEGTPGRPVLNEWPLAIVELGIQRLMLDDPAAKALRVDMERLHKALLETTNQRPFGRREPVATAAREFAAWSDLLVTRLSAAAYDATVSRRMLRRLVASSLETVPDYDSARHIGWAIEVLLKDLGPDLPRQGEIQTLFQTIRDQLQLDLPAGRDTSIETHLVQALSRAADYDPYPFRDRLKTLAELLPPE